MYLAVMVGKFVKQIVREWCPSTKGPLLPTMTDSLRAPGREVLYKRYHHFCPCPEQEGPQAWEACSIFPHEAGLQQGLLLCKVLIGGLHCIVLLNGLGNWCLGMCYRLFTILSRAPKCVSNEHSCSGCIFKDKIVRETTGGGGLPNGVSSEHSCLVFFEAFIVRWAGEGGCLRAQHSGHQS